jgi:hypothetical protein
MDNNVQSTCNNRYAHHTSPTNHIGPNAEMTALASNYHGIQPAPPVIAGAQLRHLRHQTTVTDSED